MNKLHTAYLRYVIAQHHYYATQQRHERESQVAQDVAAYTAYHEAHKAEYGGGEPTERYGMRRQLTRRYERGTGLTKR